MTPPLPLQALTDRHAAALWPAIPPHGHVEEALLAAAMRRHMSVLRPTTRGALERAAVRAVRPLLAAVDSLERKAEYVLDSLLGDRDAVVVQSADGRLEVAPLEPSAVALADGHVLLTGCGDRTELRLHQCGHSVLLRGHRRWVQATEAQLRQAGVRTASTRSWSRASLLNAAELGQQAAAALYGGGRPAGALQGLLILGAGYHWHATLQVHDGVHVGRYPGRYGERHWCLVEVDQGRASRVLGLRDGPGAALLPWAAPFELALTLYLCLRQEEGHPAAAVVAPRAQPVAGRTLSLELGFPAPPWLARQLDLLAYRESLRWPGRWSLRPAEQPSLNALIQGWYA